MNEKIYYSAEDIAKMLGVSMTVLKCKKMALKFCKFFDAS